MSRFYTKNQRGFTIIELMIATSLFSIVLTVMLASFLQVGRIYYKGVSISSTNEAGRTLVDDIVTDIRTTQATPFLGSNYFCIGHHRYTYKLTRQVQAADLTATANNVNGGIVLDDITSGCPDPNVSTNTGTNSQQLLGANMQINKLNIICNQSNSNNVCSIATHVVYYGADKTVFDTNLPIWKNTPGNPGLASGAPDAFCSGNLLSTQFCAVSDFSAVALAGGI